MSIEGLFKLGWILLATSSDGLLFLYFFILKSYNKNTVYICSLGEERVYMANMQGSSSAIDIKKRKKGWLLALRQNRKVMMIKKSFFNRKPVERVSIAKEQTVVLKFFSFLNSWLCYLGFPKTLSNITNTSIPVLFLYTLRYPPIQGIYLSCGMHIQRPIQVVVLGRENVKDI